ncbi:MAG: hypothetical protein L6Q57_05605 [Alphaproteobacteria bacterium]|nr:hypothetical protein [Alphaproteobacteria bacterium]
MDTNEHRVPASYSLVAALACASSTGAAYMCAHTASAGGRYVLTGLTSLFASVALLYAVSSIPAVCRKMQTFLAQAEDTPDRQGPQAE